MWKVEGNERKSMEMKQFSNPRVSWARGKDQRSHSGAADYKV